MIQGIERIEARYCEQATRRAAQGLPGGQAGLQPGDPAVRAGGQAALPPGEADAQVMFPPVAVESAAPHAGPSVGTSAAVQGRLPPVPMDEEDSLPSSVGSYSPEDYAALAQCDDEPLIVLEGGPDYSMLSASEKKKALAAARSAERKRQAALKRRVDRQARIGNGTPANRGGRPTRGGNGGKRGGGRTVSVPETHAQSAPVPRSPLPSLEAAFPQLHRAMAASSRSATPPPTEQQAEQPGPSIPRMGRSEPQHSEAGGSSGLELVVAEGSEATVVVEGHEGAEAARPHQAPGQEVAQEVGQPLVPSRHLALPSQDLQLANLQVRLTWIFFLVSS